MKNLSLLLTLALASAACNESHGSADDAGPRADAGLSDTGPARDADLGCSIPTPERHRATAELCAMDRGTPPIIEPIPDFSGCTTHAECTDGINGRCTGSPRNGYNCSYDQCFSDSECGSGPCDCRGARGGVGSFGSNHCLQGDCQTDADCGVGGACSPTLGTCGDFGGVVGYYCHTCEDLCTDDSDCPASSSGLPGYCAYDELAGRWACQDSQCAG